MICRLVPGILVLSLLFPASAFASLRDSIIKQTALLGQQANGPAKKPNPYKKTSMVLVAAGGGLLVLGLIQDRGAEVSTNRTGTAVTVQEKGGSKTALTVLGVVAAGGGAALYAIGESKRSAQFGIFGSPSVVGLKGAIGF